MWLVFALLAPLFFAIVHVLDSYCIDELFDKAWIGVITSAAATVVVLIIAIPYTLPLIPLAIPSWHIIILSIIAGGLIQISQALYFESLSYSEAGVVSAYWNMIPMHIVLISYLLLDTHFLAVHILGILILISSSTFMLLLDANLKTRNRTILLMFFASLMQAIAYLINDWVFNYTNFILAFSFTCIGIILVGLTPLFIKKIRNQIKTNTKNIFSYAKVFVLIEFVNVIALLFAQLAISKGSPALVAAAETTIPAFTFSISILLIVLYGRFGDRRAMQKFPLKLTTVGIMTVGVYFISIG